MNARPFGWALFCIYLSEVGQARHILSAFAILLLLVAGLAITVPVARHLLAKGPLEEVRSEEGGACGNSTSPEVAASLLPGQKLFSANCATCHALDKNLTGPALRGVEKRGPWTDRKKLIRWVKNPAAFMPRHPYTKALVNEFNGQVMPSFLQLTEAEIAAIFDYIKGAPDPLTGVPMPISVN